MRLEDLDRSVRVRGIVVDKVVEVIAVTPMGPDSILVVYQAPGERPDHRIMLRSDESGLTEEAPRVAAFDADPAEFKLAAEALRIQCAAQSDGMVAVTTSDLEPLPHQIEAVYGHMLDKVPLRFVLADDPGAGKTIMAGLYMKELLLRGDLGRCLIVAPGGLVEQWQDELREKFGLPFRLLTGDLINATALGDSVFAEHPWLIARMDQLARNEGLLTQLEATDWDLVVVDEAHRMSAHYFGAELKTTRRYQLGQLLGRVSQHLLLMTATPHAGKEDDFHLFLALVDPDRFEGRARGHAPRADGVLLRRVKEELLTFEGRPLFPKRAAYTVDYELSSAESGLYEAVTDYVRREWNRVDQLRSVGEARRGNTVGFALTVLQRRLASSPEAILRSLERRQQRLEQRLKETLNRTPSPDAADRLLGDADPDDLLDDLDAEQRESMEEEVVDAATAARSAAELRQEIAVLRNLVAIARRVRHAETDRKWTQLRGLLQDNPELRDGNGDPRKLIVFTEHRDTLNYLVERIGTLLGRPEAVVSIHGGVRREERKATQVRFTSDPTCVILVATDAAGEGLNLQRAHLMVNYDLPWNPNRIEQRFGRVHRIGQTEMCHLWNLVAVNTREGDVFLRLLAKLEEQARDLGGQVFDVLGEAFEGQPLRELLVQAIRTGELPEVREHLNKVIDDRVGEGVKKLIADRALHRDLLSLADVERIRLRMEEARARRLQPHYIEGFFRDAFSRLGGRLGPREPGRYQISHVPNLVREERGPAGPVVARYERVCFDRARVRVEDQVSAELLAPGHPLHDAVIGQTIKRYTPALERGCVLVDRLDRTEQPRLLVAIREEIVDGNDRMVARRFSYVELWQDGRSRPGTAPFLDYAPATDAERAGLSEATSAPWLAEASRTAEQWAAGVELPQWYAEVSERRAAEIERTRRLVRERLATEINHWYTEAQRLATLVSDGRKPRIQPRAAEARATELERRLERRLAELDREGHLHARPPVVGALAVVVPQGLLDGLAGAAASTYPTETMTSARRAVDAVLAAERRLGREPEEMAHNNPGYDIRSRTLDGHLVHIEVKGRVDGAEDFFVTNNEIRVGQNADRYRLALVALHPDGPAGDQVRYVHDPFAGERVSALVDGVRFSWPKMWQLGREPS
ncbi:helicase [Plantactinospora sp. BC1]|uniref:helicase-related protein n=1 Tax=Plantactinospora sp. BC1 TaxID=2108470 RepID=UPI000D152012|nr:helicase-related protein [Plantactinospora sp. BC1]AVT32681.1 helicase [Plantactinospora sp. BC1]